MRRLQLNSEVCADGGRTAEVRALNPAAGGGRLDSGPVLLRQSARYPYIAQAQITPDGTTITAVVLTGRRCSAHGLSDMVPPDLSVIQVSRASGQPLRVLYQRNLGRTTDINTGPDFLQLSQDHAGKHWMLNGGLLRRTCTDGFNGWLRDGDWCLCPGQRSGGQRGLVNGAGLPGRTALRRPARPGWAAHA